MDKYEVCKKATVTSKNDYFFRPWKLAVVKRLQNISYLFDMRPVSLRGQMKRLLPQD